ncbi:MAG TPA: hypothetical protein VIY48_12970 [Candidatus Paceibacterota bacterium]
MAATITVTVSWAQQPNEGAYSCAAESSGGIVYNEQTKKWEGTSFRSITKFTLKLKYVRTATNADEYDVTITPQGRNDALPCLSYRTQLVQIDEFGYLICRTEFFDYKFNLKAGRFIEAYLMGYVNGHNSNDDTPMLSGGVCTKVE